MKPVGGGPPTAAEGFALPAAVLALVAIGLLVTGGFVLAEQEARVARSAEGRTVSLYLAERGVADVVADWSEAHDSLGPWRSVEVRGSSDGGRWRVRVTRMSPDLFFLVSEGEAGESEARNPGGRRSVGMVVRRLAVAVDPRSALSTRRPPPAPGGGLRVSEGDRAPPGWGGVCVPDGVEVASVRAGAGTGPGGNEGRAGGDPGTVERRFRTIERQWSALAGIANHTVEGPIPPGRPGPSVRDGACDRDDPLNWGDPDAPQGPCGDYFPAIHLLSDAEIGPGAAGQGILLVGGDLTLGDGARFRGLVIVRGRLSTSGGASEISGAVVAGSAGSGEGVLQLSYSSCVLRRAGLEEGTLVRIRPLERRGWFDLSGIEGLF
ncbi:MAG: hypothetical protein GWO00_21830 [Gemmatimonadetes bacterium]|nr:hypothetical protein [Gemmatimonadota bacterium]NIT88557.1 hypothetical protein [Gemmatimonadota bacterium]NIU33498.1 hypothetical protein [Gemmatimonadota bacterium]NIV63829.1 hypothetical protein [Gemmatimonadota bacterium]NIX40781.1 hypothetical protein [Gemmatimonadota bacterium]